MQVQRLGRGGEWGQHGPGVSQFIPSTNTAEVLGPCYVSCITNTHTPCPSQDAHLVLFVCHFSRQGFSNM